MRGQTDRRIAVLASGRGSNFQALIQARREGRLNAEIAALITDRPDAPAIGIAKAEGVPIRVVERPKTPADPNRDPRIQHDQAILDGLRDLLPSYLVLAGYRRVLSPVLIRAFQDPRGYSRIVNVHPSLLPAFPGLDGYRRAFAYGCKQTGVTVHLVDEELDHGPICSQEGFSIADCASAEEVEQRGLRIEHRLYADTLEWLLHGRFTVETRTAEAGKRRICVRQD